MRYRAKVELYDEHENRVEVEWSSEHIAGADEWRSEVWRLMLVLVQWLQKRRA